MTPQPELASPEVSQQIELEHHVVDLQFFKQAAGTVISFRGVMETLEHVDRDWTNKGDRFFMESGLNLIRVVPKWRTFYRTDDIVSFLPTLKTSGLLDAFPGVVTFGISMGGFGAIAFGRALGATKTIALAPFSTLSPAIAPWDDRYPVASETLDWTGPLHDAATESAAPAQTLLFYDPFEARDAAHIRRIVAPRRAAGRETALYRTPGAGHDVFTMLANLKLLKPAVRQFLFYGSRPVEVHQAMRLRRRLEPYYDALAKHERVAGSPVFQRIVAAQKEAHRREGTLVSHAAPSPKAAGSASPTPPTTSATAPSEPLTPALSEQIELDHHVVDLKFFRQALGTIVVFRGVKETLEHVDRDWTSKGDRFLMRSGFNLIRVVPKWRSYYRTADVLEFLPTLKSGGLLDQFPCVVTYGVSMGGYGAVAYARALGADKTVALAPLSTLSRTVAPWEDRFKKSSERLDWEGPLHDAATEIAAPAQALFVYDPLDPKERAHARRLTAPREEAGRETRLLRIPGVGHNVYAPLATLGLIKPMMQGFLLAEPPLADLQRALRARRRFEQYYDALESHPRVAQSPMFQRILSDHKDAHRRDGSMIAQASSPRPSTPGTTTPGTTTPGTTTPWALMLGDDAGPSPTPTAHP